jgi:two-component system sensor kinase FixL
MAVTSAKRKCRVKRCGNYLKTSRPELPILPAMLTPAEAPGAVHRPDAAAKLQALLDTTQDGVVMFDHHGRIESMNRAAERLFDYDESEVLGRDIGLLMTESRQAHAELVARHPHSSISSLGAAGRDALARRRDGTTFPVFLSIGRIGTVDPPSFVGLMRDATVLDQARRAQERLSHVSRLTMLGEMVAGIAHELNQPLAAIATYAQAGERLLSTPATDLADVQVALGQIAAQALRAGEIILRLRSLARQPLSRRELRDLNEVVRELTPLIHADARQHDIRVLIDLAPEHLLAEHDPEQIQQVLLNLLHNAIEALGQEPAGTREIHISTMLTTDGHVQLCVRDNGPGVDPGIRQRMFHPFCTTKPAGTGLGLAISYSIAKAHGGTLEHVRSDTPGATFRLVLPPFRGNLS